MVSMSQYILPVRSHSITIWCADSLCLHGRYASPYVAHVAIVDRHIVDHHIVPMWSECPPYCVNLLCQSIVSIHCVYIVSMCHDMGGIDSYHPSRNSRDGATDHNTKQPSHRSDRLDCRVRSHWAIRNWVILWTSPHLVPIGFSAWDHV